MSDAIQAARFRYLRDNCQHCGGLMRPVYGGDPCTCPENAASVAAGQLQRAHQQERQKLLDHYRDTAVALRTVALVPAGSGDNSDTRSAGPVRDHDGDGECTLDRGSAAVGTRLSDAREGGSVSAYVERIRQFVLWAGDIVFATTLRTVLWLLVTVAYFSLYLALLLVHDPPLYVSLPAVLPLYAVGFLGSLQRWARRRRPACCANCYDFRHR